MLFSFGDSKVEQCDPIGRASRLQAFDADIHFDVMSNLGWTNHSGRVGARDPRAQGVIRVLVIALDAVRDDRAP